MTDRDHFAAAALTGLLAQGDDGSFSEESYVRGAYRWADAMLRERAKTNHDAAPAAIVPEPEPEPAARRRPAGGTGDTDHGAAPAARASVGRPRTDNADLPICAGTGDTPDSPKPINDCVSDRSKPITGPDPDSRVWETHTPATHATQGECSKPREGKEPVAWAVMRHGKAEQVAVHPVYLSGDIHRVAPLYAYQPPMLTAAERDAIQTAMNAYGSDNASPECAAIEATLWGLLERTK